MNPSRFLVALALLVPSGAHAHEHWFSPTDYVAVPGHAIAVAVRTGEGLCGPARPYRGGRTVRFVARADRTLDLAPMATEDDSIWARFEPADAKGVQIAWESNFVTHQMEGAEFDAYLASTGLDGPLAARQAVHDTSTGRERYRRCTKIWLSGGSGKDARERATQPVGLPLEIVPLDVPGESGELRVKVLFQGAPLANALVQAWQAPFASGTAPRICVEDRRADATWRGRTDQKGIVNVKCADPGEWLIATVHMVESAARDEADWESTWASLAFGRLASR